MRWLVLIILFGMQALVGIYAATEIPMRFEEGLLWVEARTPLSEKPLRFVVDTGAEVSVINSETARHLGIKLGRKVMVSGVNSSEPGHWLSKWQGEVAGMKLPEQCLVLNLSALAAACSNRLDGLIGADFFRTRIVQIDYKSRCLRILDPKTKFTLQSGIPLQVSPSMTIKVSVDNSKAASVRLDTGCASALEWVARGSTIKATSTRVAVGLAPISIPQAIAQVKVGDQSIHGVQIGLHSRPIFPGESGLIGNGILSLFDSITIDSIHGRLYLGALLE